jgi:hypothetical protein
MLPAYSRNCEDRSEANPAYSTPLKDRSEANSVYSINSKSKRSQLCLFHKLDWSKRSEVCLFQKFERTKRSELCLFHKLDRSKRSEVCLFHKFERMKRSEVCFSTNSKNRSGASSRNRQDRSEKKRTGYWIEVKRTEAVFLKLLWNPGIDSKEVIPPAYALAGLCNNPIPARFLAPSDCSKAP